MKLSEIKNHVPPGFVSRQVGPTERLFWSSVEDGFRFVAVSASGYDSTDHCWEDPGTLCDILAWGSWSKSTAFTIHVELEGGRLCLPDPQFWASLFLSLGELEGEYLR